MGNNIDILFVNPPLSLEERYGHLSPGGSLIPPLGLCCLAAVTRKKGFETRILDAPAHCFTIKNTVEEILRFNPRYLGLTAATVSIHNAGKVAQLVKSRNKNIKILIGGSHLTSVAEKTMNIFSGFDIGVVGEGEITIIELLETLDGSNNNYDLTQIDGLIFRQDGKLQVNAPRKYIEDLDSLPKPTWDLLPELKKHYRPSILRGYYLPATGIVTSRGCTGKCTFCDRSMFGSKLRANSAERVVEIMEELHLKYGMKEIFIFDDNIMLFRQRLEKICALLIEKRMKLKWSCFARIDFAYPDGLKMMKEAGCHLVAYGIESGNQEMLNFLQKNITLEKVRKVIRWTKQAGLIAEGLFMMGVPRETNKTMETTINFAKSNPLDDIAVTIFTPLPGSKLYKEIDQFGRFHEDWKKMSQHYPVFVPDGLTMEEIIRFNNKALREFYLRPQKIPNLLRRFKSIRHLAGFIYAGMLFIIGVMGIKRK
jgi:anaerobic magnesium-protoporphyrin IX monomethyl ester cyclase